MAEAEFLSGGSELGERIRRHDWAATRLGPLKDWPHACAGLSVPPKRGFLNFAIAN